MVKVGFGNNERQNNIWSEYITNWVMIRPTGIGTTYAGKMIEIKGGEYAVLSPFQDGHFDEEKGFICGMNDGRSLVPLLGSVIEPTTLKNIEDYCKYKNRESEKERLKAKEEKKSDK